MHLLIELLLKMYDLYDSCIFYNVLINDLYFLLGNFFFSAHNEWYSDILFEL